MLTHKSLLNKYPISGHLAISPIFWILVIEVAFENQSRTQETFIEQAKESHKASSTMMHFLLMRKSSKTDWETKTTPIIGQLLHHQYDTGKVRYFILNDYLVSIFKLQYDSHKLTVFSTFSLVRRNRWWRTSFIFRRKSLSKNLISSKI